MAGSLEVNAAIHKNYKYISPPSTLIDCSNFILNLTERKFIHIGFDPSDNFNVTIHMITPARHIVIAPEFLKRVFSFIGNILSFIKDRPHKFKKILFLENNSISITNTAYRGRNMLAFNSKIRKGYRVLLSRTDLLTLQDLERSIYESINTKSIKFRSMILEQFDTICRIIENKITRSRLSNIDEIKSFIFRIYDNEVMKNFPKSKQSFVSQIKLFASEQIVKRFHDNKEKDSSPQSVADVLKELFIFISNFTVSFRLCLNFLKQFLINNCCLASQ